MQPLRPDSLSGLRNYMEMATIYVDGASRGNPGPAGVGILINSQSHTEAQVSCYIGEATNNQAEYKALIIALEEAAKLGAKHVDVRMDSELVVKQLNGSYKVRDTKLKPLFRQVKQLLTRFDSFAIMHIPRQQNRIADSLANQAIDEEIRRRYVERRVAI